MNSSFPSWHIVLIQVKWLHVAYQDWCHTDNCCLNQAHIWSKMMRMHICPKICHFLLSTVSITERPKNKIMKKSGIHSSVPWRDSTLKQVLFCWVSKKIVKNDVSLSLYFMAEVLFRKIYFVIVGVPKYMTFCIFSGQPVKQKLL